MSNSASERLQRNVERIMHLWEERARQEVGADMPHDSLVLRDSLPQYLTQLSDALSTLHRSPTQLKADKVESTCLGNEHGRDRAGYADYSISELILEYHILRQVIFQVLEADAPLGVRERDIVINSIEQAVNDAATQFSQTLHDIQALFTETLTHDLRGPLTVVKTGTYLMLQRLERGAKVDDVAARIINAADRMDAMIQNLLDAGQLRAGQDLKLDCEACDLEQLVQDVAADLGFVHRDRFMVVSEGAVMVYCSPKEMRRVIENIATNAVKYGALGTPITLTLQQTATQISLTIHNKGKPITSDAQAILFQQFRRTTAAGEQTGWGLGLFLAKSLVEAHQGTIAVESAEGKGTSFIVTLPRLQLAEN